MLLPTPFMHSILLPFTKTCFPLRLLILTYILIFSSTQIVDNVFLILSAVNRAAAL